MKRNWNWPLRVGFVVAVGGLFSYEFFAQFPITRDFPWANLLLFAAAGIFLAEFLIDSTRRIRWVNVTENIAVRARPEQALKAFDEMEQTAAR